MNYNVIIEKYYQKSTPLYNILLKHNSDVASKAVDIARSHRLEVDLEFVHEAAMLHDIGIFLTNAPSIQCFGTHEYIEHGYLGAELLRNEGYPAHALVCERHTGTGLSLEEIVRRKLPLPHRDMIPISLEEQLICYADLFYSKTHLDREASPDIVRQKLARWGEESVAIFERWHQMFG